MANTHKEIVTGTNGSGKDVWIVVTIDVNGNWIWQEHFTNKAEAESWLKYA